ncbi:CcdB family protein [Tepidimonas fonticaldi]|uniref:CcdB family protein n=1 Tax=Tepidimonas fonticaldi TaxID=1101373 RepID=UPI0018D4D938|nr:CcdB family protein [Tepidimonas fonticaldi]
MPVFVLDEVELVLETPKLGAIPRRLLRRRVDNWSAQQDVINGALDFLFHGF